MRTWFLGSAGQLSAASNYRWDACMLCSHCQEHKGGMLTLRFSGRRRSHGSIHSSRRRCSHGSGYSCIHGSGHSCIHGSGHSGVHGSGHSCATGARTRVGLHGGLQAMPHRVSKSRGRETLHRLTSDSTCCSKVKGSGQAARERPCAPLLPFNCVCCPCAGTTSCKDLVGHKSEKEGAIHLPAGMSRSSQLPRWR